MNTSAPHCYAHPRPAVTVDVVTCRVVNDELQVLLIQRGGEPYKGCWANPGGFVNENERLIDAAHRELKEETGLTDVALFQFGAFGDPGRDPRGWTIAIGFVGYQNAPTQSAQAGDDAQALAWFPVSDLPPLAFDHRAIITAALRHVGSNDHLTKAIAGQGGALIIDKAHDCLAP